MGKVLRVLLIAYACEPNKGSEPGVGWNWATSLSRHCHVTILTRLNNKEAVEKELERCRIENLNFIYYDIPFFVELKRWHIISITIYYILWLIYSVRFIRRNRLENDFDLIHHLTINTFQVPVPIYKLTPSSVWGPVGGGIVAPLFAFFHLGFFYGIAESLRTLITTIGRYRPAIIRALKGYKKVIFANNETAQFLIHMNGNAPVHLETGVAESDVNNDFRNYALNDPSSVRILFVGALIPRKGLHILLDACSKLDDSFHLTIIGKGPLADMMKKVVRKKGLTSSVTFEGFIQHNKLHEFYQTHDVFVFPSIRDTSGNVVLEAMASGLPVITFDHHGMKDILDSSCGIKIPVQSYDQMVQDLVHAIHTLAGDEKLRSSYGVNAIKRIKSMYLWEQKAKWMFQIYMDTINAPSANSQ